MHLARQSQEGFSIKIDLILRFLVRCSFHGIHQIVTVWFHQKELNQERTYYSHSFVIEMAKCA